MDYQKSITIQAIDPRIIEGGFERLEKRFADFENQWKTQKQTADPDGYMTKADVCELLKCSLVTVQNLTKAGQLKAYRLGGKVLYKRSEVFAAPIQIKKGGAK